MLIGAIATMAQRAVPVGSGSYASFVPLAESKTSEHGGCQAYQMEHRPIYIVDSLQTRTFPSNDWWTYGLVEPWTGNLWSYPAISWADASGVHIAKLTHWEPTGREMKWSDQVNIATLHDDNTPVDFVEKRLSDWSDFMIRYAMEQEDAKVEVTVMRGSPLIWLEYTGCKPRYTNPAPERYAIWQTTVGSKTLVTVAVLTDGMGQTELAPYASRVPRNTRYRYAYDAATAALSTTFHVDYEDLNPTSASGVVMGFLPHHYYHTTTNCTFGAATYQTPRGVMKMTSGNDFTFTYPVHGFMPYFPLPDAGLQGYDRNRMIALCQQYAKLGNFGADTYWGGKGLTQMMHYMSAALQLGDTATYRMAKTRLKDVLVNWYTYTPGETEFYFARYSRWGALVGFDSSYDSDTFNDHHFHYGYFVYASAVLCMLDEEFKTQYGPMVREVARDYANWTRDDRQDKSTTLAEPWMRMFSPYDGHSYAGGMGNGGNGNGQESTSEAMQGWTGLWLLGAALGDAEMLEAGIMGYTVEARATAEYWFDRGDYTNGARQRSNFDRTKYDKPWSTNLTMAGVGWWTWFSGDPVWMHSIQWLPISPGLQNYLSENLEFAAYDYGEMYRYKEVGNYEAATGGLGDESGLGNVCLSYLALFDPDSAARVWDRMDRTNKNLAKNPDTGGITYMLAHGLRQYGNQCHSVLADYPLAMAYVRGNDTTYAIYNTGTSERTVRFFTGTKTLRQLKAAPGAMTLYRGGQKIHEVHAIEDDKTPKPQDPIAAAWQHEYPNIALHKSVSESSHENAGCLAVNLTDGDIHTRWGSEHRDNEWVQVDLGAQYYVDHVTLRWEAAYASRYTLSISDDGQSWRTVEYSGAGGVETRHFASDMMQQYSLTQCRGRYIRLVGVERATGYGTSIYEMEVYGLPLSGNNNTLTTLEISSTTETLAPGETPQYEVHGYNYMGTELPISPTTSTTITATTYTLTAEVGGLKASYSWPILEQVTTTAVSVRPKQVTMAVGQQQLFRIETLDQFGYVQDTETQSYTATALGEDTLFITRGAYSDTAYIHVVNYSDLNLALGKRTTASGEENAGTKAENATDGNPATRWGSRHQDDEWLQVDLGANYYVCQVRLSWEAAYATSYEILLSTDNLNFTSVYSQTDGKGGEEDIYFRLTEARYVRIVCHTRKTAYGSSLYELEVYGSDNPDLAHPTAVELDQTALTLEVGDSEDLTAVVLPRMADQTVVWTSSDSAVAIVADGHVSALTAGTAAICATSTEDPTVSDTCVVTVLAPYDKHWYGSVADTERGVSFRYTLTYLTDKHVECRAEITCSQPGMATSSWSIDGEWKDLEHIGDYYTRTSIKTFERGEKVHCFFYQPYQGGAARLDFDYVVGAENPPLTPTGLDASEVAPTARKQVVDGQLRILRGAHLYDATGRIVK